MAYDKGNRPEGGFKRRGGGRRRKKVCVFCGKENNEIDYKDTAKLRKYVMKIFGTRPSFLFFLVRNRMPSLPKPKGTENFCR